MIRKLVGRLFGFEEQIAQLERKVKELGWDQCFGMFTRAAFIEVCRMQPRMTRAVAFLDFDRVHELNHEVGYEEVNRRVRALFAGSMRKSDIVGRQFSGDEVVILFDTPDIGTAGTLLQVLRTRAGELGLSFTSAVGLWDKDEPLHEVIERLGEKVLAKKRLRGAALERRSSPAGLASLAAVQGS